MNSEHQNDSIVFFTIPNLLTVIRIALIPLIMYLYIERADYVLTAGVFVLSSLTDVIDGKIARKYNMISDVGKALDPLADKLTQFSLMMCLMMRFKHMIWPLILIVIKELSSGILGLFTLKKTGMFEGAAWHGKLTTVLLFVLMFMHLLWRKIPEIVSNISIAVCCSMMIFSFIMYSLRYFRMLKAGKYKTGQK